MRERNLYDNETLVMYPFRWENVEKVESIRKQLTYKPIQKVEGFGKVWKEKT